MNNLGIIRAKKISNSLNSKGFEYKYLIKLFFILIRYINNFNITIKNN